MSHIKFLAQDDEAEAKLRRNATNNVWFVTQQGRLCRTLGDKPVSELTDNEIISLMENSQSVLNFSGMDKSDANLIASSFAMSQALLNAIDFMRVTKDAFWHPQDSESKKAFLEVGESFQTIYNDLMIAIVFAAKGQEEAVALRDTLSRKQAMANLKVAGNA